MGDGLVLFEISVVDKRVGQNYHLFYEDNNMWFVEGRAGA